MILDSILFIYNYSLPIVLALCVLTTCLRILALPFLKDSGMADYLTALRSLGFNVLYSAFPLSFTLTSLAYLPIELTPYQLPALLVLASVFGIGILAIVLDGIYFFVVRLVLPKNK